VAVLRKKGPIGPLDGVMAKAEEVAKKNLGGADLETANTELEAILAEAAASASEKQKKPIQNKKEREEAPFFFLDPESSNVQSLKGYFAFDKFPINQLISRNDTERKRQIYFAGQTVCEVLQAKNKELLKVIHTGLKTFCRNESMGDDGCDFRLGQEGIIAMQPFLASQRIDLPEDDFLLLLKEEYPLLSGFSDSIRATLIATSKRELPSLLEKVIFIFITVVHRHRIWKLPVCVRSREEWRRELSLEKPSVCGRLAGEEFGIINDGQAGKGVTTLPVRECGDSGAPQGRHQRKGCWAKRKAVKKGGKSREGRGGAWG